MKKSVSFVMAALMAASLATTGSMTVLADAMLRLQYSILRQR